MGSSLMYTIFISAIIVVIAIILLYNMRRDSNGIDNASVGSCAQSLNGGCCGGVNCDRHHSKKEYQVVYFEDEELDVYAGRDPHQYTLEEVKEFSEVLNTLREEEVKPWLKSLARRNIELPIELTKDLKI